MFPLSTEELIWAQRNRTFGSTDPEHRTEEFYFFFSELPMYMME